LDLINPLAPFLRKSQARMAPIARFEKGSYFGARAGLQVKHMLGRLASLAIEL